MTMAERRAGANDPPERAGSARSLLLFASLLLLLALKGDGHFPLPAATPEPLFQLYILGLTVLFALGLVMLLRSPSEREPLASPAPPESAGASIGGSRALRTAALAGSVFALLDGCLLWLEARRFAGFGYTWHPWAAASITLAPALALAFLALRRTAPPAGALLGVAAAGHAAHVFYAAAWFPLAAARSDMLPLLAAAGRELLAGRDPYALYQLTHGAAVPLTYLPGMVAAYLPAALLGLDPRLLSLAYTLGAALLLYRKARAGAAAYLAIFLLSPYLIYRHEIYLAPCWLLLALAWLLLARRRPAALAACCGLLALTSQLLAIPAAAMAVFVWRRDGRRAGLRFAAIAAAVCALPLAPFVLADPVSFARGTLSHWTAARNLQSFGLAYWLIALLPLPVLRALQAAAVAFLLIRIPPAATADRPDPFEDTLVGLPGALPPAPPGLWISPRRRRSVFVMSALAVALFAALNTVVWTYFYLLVLYLALLAQLVPQRAQSAAGAGEPMP
jgi:hypothetical protein